METNLSLVEKMRRDFGIEMPLLEEDDTPESYFGKLSDILRVKRGWSIRRNVTLALLSFGKILMYRDLDPRTWAADQNIALHPLVRELFEGSKNTDIALAEEYPIDAPELVNDPTSSVTLTVPGTAHLCMRFAVRIWSSRVRREPESHKRSPT